MDPASLGGGAAAVVHAPGTTKRRRTKTLKQVVTVFVDNAP